MISRGKDSVKKLTQNLIGGINKPKTKQSRHLKSRTRGKIVSKRQKKHHSKPRSLENYLIKKKPVLKMMQSGSCECSKSELDVLTVPPTMTTMQESQWV